MTTINQLVEETFRLLNVSLSEEANKLVGLTTDSATTLTFSYDLGGIRPGSILNIGTEVIRVWSVDANAKTAVVERGWAGSDPTVLADGSVVWVNPRFSRASAYTALSDEIRDLSSPANGLYRMETYDFTTTASVQEVIDELDLLSVYEVRVAEPANDVWSQVRDWRVVVKNNTATTGSPTHITTLEIPSIGAGRTVRVWYKAEFTAPLALDPADDVRTATGVPEHMYDILRYGIASRLAPIKEMQRNNIDSQGNARRAEEVPSGYISRYAATVYQQKRQERIVAEATRLARMYPDRKYSA